MVMIHVFASRADSSCGDFLQLVCMAKVGSFPYDKNRYGFMKVVITKQAALACGVCGSRNYTITRTKPTK